MKRNDLSLYVAALLLCSAGTVGARAQWTAPSQEELTMTSQKEAPGAPAVYLYREDITDDSLHSFSRYTRLKVLTERGKKYADVELPYYSVANGSGFNADDIAGRTIHPDGTVIPFTGKPMQKVVKKSGDVKAMETVFTLPDVEVGSIIEYRYKLRSGDHYFHSPSWYVQSELYTRKAHYLWRPTNEQLYNKSDHEQWTSRIAWTPILPPGMQVKQTRLPSIGNKTGQGILELDVHDIPPAPEEEMMPPVKSFSYRVLFYYSPYASMDEFWKSEGKYWGKTRDEFIGPGSGVRAAVQQIVAPGDTPEQKLKKFYSSIMELENTDLTREHSILEDKSSGLKDVHTTDDVLARKRGNGDQLAALFVAMARATGMKAYLMRVTNRDTSLFLTSYLSMDQLDDDIAIVNVNGKEEFFDPGSRYCPYGHLAWKHSFAQGIRQSESGVVIAEAAGDGYDYSKMMRVANLTIDPQGMAVGTVKFTYLGSPALGWRQRALAGDEVGLKQELQTSAQQQLPGGMEVTVATITNLKDYEQPLIVLFNIKGAIGSPTGKRLLIPADLFEGNTKPLFTHETREQPVYFNYANTVQDAIRVNFPPGFTVESLPAKEADTLKSGAINAGTSGLYNLSTEATPTSFTIRRNYVLGEIVFLTRMYPELRGFYSKLEAKDQEPVVLSVATGKSSGQE